MRDETWSLPQLATPHLNYPNLACANHITFLKFYFAHCVSLQNHVVSYAIKEEEDIILGLDMRSH